MQFYKLVNLLCLLIGRQVKASGAKKGKNPSKDAGEKKGKDNKKAENPEISENYDSAETESNPEDYQANPNAECDCGDIYCPDCNPDGECPEGYSLNEEGEYVPDDNPEE